MNALPLLALLAAESPVDLVEPLIGTARGTARKDQTIALSRSRPRASTASPSPAPG